MDGKAEMLKQRHPAADFDHMESFDDLFATLEGEVVLFLLLENAIVLLKKSSQSCYSTNLFISLNLFMDILK